MVWPLGQCLRFGHIFVEKVRGSHCDSDGGTQVILLCFCFAAKVIQQYSNFKHKIMTLLRQQLTIANGTHMRKVRVFRCMSTENLQETLFQIVRQIPN